MSLAIDPNLVTAVLLASGRYEVQPGTFELDSYEFVEPHSNPDRNGHILHGGGNSGVCATGFDFLVSPNGPRMAGPLTAILAVEITE